MLLQLNSMSSALRALNPSDTIWYKLQVSNIKIEHLQSKLDSLEKVMTRTQIGSGFFSDIISQNLYMYTGIIGLLALVNWSAIAYIMKTHKTLVEKTTNQAIATIKEEFDQKTETFTSVLVNTNYDVNRAMFFILNRENDYSNLISWILSSLYAFVLKTVHPDNKYFDKDFSIINSWFDQAELVCGKLSVGDPNIKDNANNLHFYIDYLLENISDVNMIDRLLALETDLNHIIYSKPQPPENIMED